MSGSTATSNNSSHGTGTSRIADREQYKLARYFEAVAVNSAGIAEHKTIHDAAAVDRRTADTYDGLLERLFITEQIPAWTSSRLDRLIKMPKRYVVDTFVMARLRPEISRLGRRARVHHLRTKAGREEIGIVIELPGGKLIGLEIKASAAPRPSDAKHLVWLQARFPDRFVAGALLHTGPDIIELGNRIHALPISSFWA